MLPSTIAPPAPEPGYLRIAHVNSELGHSGGEAQMFMLMHGLRERGHHNLLCCRAGSRSAERAERDGFEVHTTSMRNDLDLGGLLGLRRVLRRSEPQVVNLHTGRASWLGGLACWSSGLPAVVIRRMDRRVRGGLRTRLVYRILNRAVVAVSPAVVDCLVQGGVPREAVELICDAVDPQALRPSRSAAEVRAALGLAPGRTLLLALASLDRRKGLDVLLDALRRVLDGERSARPMLWIAGDGPERADLEARTRSLDLGEAVRLLGRREDAPDLLNACDVFVLPSRREGLGVAALEAMAVGKPVVASRVGGLGQAVVHGETGLLVPPEDPEALARALGQVLADPALRQRLGAAGPRHIEAHFLGRDQVLAYERLYRRLL
jgi:glycosyltransferase involved in cell wall biosynthesis